MNFEQYQKVTVGVDCVILTSDLHKEANIRKRQTRGIQVLLLKRNIEPYKDMWSIPGGLVESDKSLVDTLDSKVLKKINFKDYYKEQLYTYGDNLDRDPRGRVISVAYTALINKTNAIDIKSTRYGEVKWFWAYLDSSNCTHIIDTDTEKEIESLAFDHKDIISTALQRLKNKVMYTDVAYRVIPEKFTIAELQDVYEEILGKQIYSFRRYVNNYIKECQEYTGQGAHRPSMLYAYNGRFEEEH